jgi:hypothetical protein
MTTYIVNFNPEVDLPIYSEKNEKILGNDNYPASTYYWCVTILGKKQNG